MRLLETREYYRLSAHEIMLPPLRERKKDLPLLVNHSLDEASRKLSKKKLTTPPKLDGLLESYDFPGNIMSCGRWYSTL